VDDISFISNQRCFDNNDQVVFTPLQFVILDPNRKERSGMAEVLIFAS
jgi:hypothetical protein